MMDNSITLKRSVLVKVVMTPGFREQIVQEARDAIKRIEDNHQALESAAATQVAQMDPAAQEQGASFSTQIAQERERLSSLRAQLDWRIREIEAVQDGAELPFRAFEGEVTISPGDDFLMKMAQAEIVLRDWQVVEIRQG